MNRNKLWIWAIIAAQASFLLGWAGYHEMIRQHSPVIRLQGRPVDPQDLLRGDYMTLNYEISRVKLPEVPAAKANMGAEIWVLLEQHGRFHEAIAASLTQPEAKPGQVLVRGRLGYDWRRSDPDTVHVDYGIEKYFVPEGKGTPRFKTIEIEVSVSPEHRLYVRQVLLDGAAFP